jgi:hypothetical protein
VSTEDAAEGCCQNWDAPRCALGTKTVGRRPIRKLIRARFRSGQWATTGNRITVYLGLEEESALLGMFATELENPGAHAARGVD